MSEDGAPLSGAGRFFDGIAEEPYPGVVRRTFDSQHATVVSYRFAPGATFPMHRHPQEQITIVQEGTIEFTVGGQVSTLTPESWSVVGPGLEHGLRAGPEGARILTIVIPRRQAPGEYTVLQ